MKQRNGRQKFHDLRLLTFQDWIVPRNSRRRRATDIMKNSRLPVFGYTKMDNGPPLSPISSQFAWAGHVLPDLVQEQSDRLLRRLERPKTTDNRLSRFGSHQLKTGKTLRPMTAAPSNNRDLVSTSFKVNGTKYEGTAINEFPPPETIKSHCEMAQEQEDHVSPVSERSSSPDFMSNLYKEYEEKIALEGNSDVPSPHLSRVPTSQPPAAKLLRRPNAQFHKGNYIRRKSNSSQTSPPVAEKTVQIHCVVKLPSDQNDFTSTNKSFSQTQPSSHSIGLKKLSKSETWLDLSELCQSSSDDEITHVPNGLRVPRPSLASESTCSLKLADIPSETDDTHDIEKKTKSKQTRPSSSKTRRSHTKSRTKKRRPINNMEECAKNENTATCKKAQGKRIRSCDKLREEIETQMSKLDLDKSGRNTNNSSHEGPAPLIIGRPKPTDSIITTSAVSQDSNAGLTRSVTGRQSIFSMRNSLPLKKIPIQILSDPFSSNFKAYNVRRDLIHGGHDHASH